MPRMLTIDRETIGHLLVLAWTRWLELELEALDADPADLERAQAASAFARRAITKVEAAMAYDRIEHTGEQRANVTTARES